MFFNLFKRAPSSFCFWEAWMIHLLTIVCGSIVATALICFVYRLTPSVIGLVLCIGFVVAWATAPSTKVHEQKKIKGHSEKHLLPWDIVLLERVQE